MKPALKVKANEQTAQETEEVLAPFVLPEI